MDFKFSVDMPNQHFPVASYKGGCTGSGKKSTDDKELLGGHRLVEMTPGAKPRILSATGCAGRRAPRKQPSLLPSPMVSCGPPSSPQIG